MSAGRVGEPGIEVKALGRLIIGNIFVVNGSAVMFSPCVGRTMG